MGATFSRVKNWTTEVLSNTDLNTEIDNILNNLGPSGVDDYSTNSTQMRLQTSPGAVGSESLPTSLAGEVERLRYVIQRMIGGSTTYWYEAPPSTLGDIVAALGTGLPTYRIVSGRTTGNSSQLCALIPNGVSASVVLSASVTPLVYYIGGVQYSITANVTLTGLSLAPTTNNTCSFNNTAAAGQQWTKFLGMYRTQIDVDGMNTSVAAVVGQVAAFQSGAEYFTGYLNSSIAITNVWRGSLFNQSANNVTAVGLTDNAEIKLLRLAWIFANTNSSLAVTYTNPIVSPEQPAGPNTGDYWFDLGTTAWKTFNSSTWVAANATLIGITLQTTAACVAARTFDSYKAMNSLNGINLDNVSNTVIQATDANAEVSIFGNTNRFGPSRPVWDIAADLESGMTESANYTYFAYMKENGNTALSDRNPLMRRDLQGLYHPAETWRCLGSVYNNGSSNFDSAARSFGSSQAERQFLGDPRAYGITYQTAATTPSVAQALTVPNQLLIGGNFGVGASIWATYATAFNYGDIATLSLTPGIWRLQGSVVWSMVTASETVANLVIDNQQGTALNVGVPAWGLNGSFMSCKTATAAGPGYSTQYTPELFVQVTATQNWYLKGSLNSSLAGASFVGPRFTAIRYDNLTGLPL